MGNKYNKISIDIENNIINEYINGYGCTTISRKYNVSPATVHNMLKRNNIKSRTHKEASTKYKFNENYFEIIDTEEKAYWLGFIYADGALINNQYANSLKIDLSVCDIEHLYKIRNCMDSDVNIPTYKASKTNYSQNTEYARFTLRSDKICNDLVNQGVSYNKTLVLKKPNINKDLYSHFIRGYLDGDGCITYYHPKGYISKKKSYSVKIVGTIEILDFIKDFIEEKTDITIKKYYYRKKEHKVASLEVGGNKQVEEILNLLYKNSNIYLDRKYKLYLDVLKNNSPMQQ